MKRIIVIISAFLLTTAIVFAQEGRKYEIGAGTSYGIGFGMDRANSYSFDVFGGYKFSPNWVAGAGVNYVNYVGTHYFPSGIENVLVSTGGYHAYRPYLYTRYDFLPAWKWMPFAGAKLGYAFFSDSNIQYNVIVPSFSGYTGGTFNPADYEYLRALDHSLGIKGNVYGSIDLGFARYMGTKGSKLSLGVSLDLQPVKFEYNGTSKDKFHYSVGPKAGFSF